jgi:hypothetical protein
MGLCPDGVVPGWGCARMGAMTVPAGNGIDNAHPS